MSPRGIIVVEGGDCAGKTTLARHLVERYGARYLHSTVRKDIWRWHSGALRLAARLADSQLVVLDRHWLSEQVYGQVFRGAPGYDLGARCLDRVLQRFGAVTVLCVPSDLQWQEKTHAKRAGDGGERFASVRAIATRYADLLSGNLAHAGETYLDQLIQFGAFGQRPDVLRYDVLTDGQDLDAFALRLLRRLRSYRLAQVAAGLDSTRPNLAGHRLRAQYLFVGEHVSPQVRGRQPRWPFVWHDGLSAATYLNQALHRAAFDETRGLWTNALEPDDHLEALLKLRLRVIALGRVAERRVLALGGESVHVRHPQFVRRFQSKFADYTAQLQEAMG